MAISIFRKDSVRNNPARDALRRHRADVAKLEAVRADVVEKDTQAANAVAAEATAAAAVQSLRDEIDRLHADARYAGATADTSRQDRALAEAEQNHKRAGLVARGAQSVREKYAADLRDLAVQLNASYAKTPRLLHSTLLEMVGDAAPELAEAEARLRAVHRRVFALATAADKLAMQHQFGEFTGSAGFFDLRITKPMHPAYADGQTPDQAHAAYQADAKTFDREAEAQVHALLHGTAKD